MGGLFTLCCTSYSTKNRTIILEGVWGTQPSPNRGFGGESPN
ncbi:hypothetical protein FDUTEX481_02522 [Tolypothrix sp. PCC 7601]|nr:hypothetical protein FDUTEX481_02522 [Tolypothrix sp. PCC 7601]